MQKAFRDIVERLEELNIENSCQDCRYRGVCDKVEETATGSTDLCGATMRYLALEIVNQTAEEYKSNDGWIPCSERLPEEDEYVLCSLNEDNPTIIHTIIIAKYDGCSYWHNGTVVAWQPLPQPYVKEK